MFFQHHRFQVWNQSQHPYKHSLSEFLYVNPAMPGVTNMESALNWVLAVLYPNTQDAVATTAALPTEGNTINDYRVVQDDGDGKAASYRWEKREGDVSPKWYKVMDMDWSTDSILAQFLNITSDVYVIQKGKQDLDENGDPIAGIFAGQRIWGGNIADTNLTLDANSVDATGYVQINSHFRPTVHNTWDLSTTGERWKDGYFQGNLVVGNMTIATGSITDTSGAISFGDENLSTTGNVQALNVTGTNSVVAGDLTLSNGSIISSSGAISFGDENITSTGTFTGAPGSTFGDIGLGVGSITSTSGAISFGDENLSTTGTLGAGVTTVSQLDSGNTRLTGNTLSITNLDGNLNLAANGAGVVDIQSALQTLGQTVTGTVGITGQLNIDNLRLDANELSSQNLNGDISLSPNGSGNIVLTGTIRPNVDGAANLGTSLIRFGELFLSTSLRDGTNTFLMSELMDLRSANFRDSGRTQAAQTGDALFFDGSQWLASAPDAEIDHGTLLAASLLDDDHTQYMHLSGRVGGQDLVGGTAASETLTLESTAHATKGSILFKDTLAPFTNASYLAGWSGTDLGDASHYLNDVYTKGEFKGFRLENFTSGTLPAASGQNIGRVVYATDTNKAYVDTGTAIKVLGVSKFLSDTAWNGTDTVKDVTVSSEIADARNAIWAIHDNANDYERIYCNIKAISATQVRITVSPALPAGSYRLIGIE